MRVFLTGATGYIGAAVLDALVRAGHEAGALGNEAGTAAEKHAHPGRGGRRRLSAIWRDPAWYPRCRRRLRRLHSHGSRNRNRKATSLERAGLKRNAARARRRPRPRRRSSIRRGCGCSDLDAGARRRGRHTDSADAGGLGRAGPSKRRILHRWRPGVRTIVLRPGIVYGGAKGFISDNADRRRQRPDACHRAGRESLAGGLRPRPRGAVRPAGLHRQRQRHLPRYGNESDETVRDIVEAIATHMPA